MKGIATEIQFAREELGINDLDFADALDSWISGSGKVGKLLANSAEDPLPETIAVPIDHLMSLLEATQVLIWLLGLRAGGVRSERERAHLKQP